MEKNRMLLSEYVRGLRTREGLSLEEFGKKYNMSRAGVSKYENGAFDDPSLLVATRFCKTFNIDLAEFVVGFFYTNKKIDKAFTTAKHLSKRIGNELFDLEGKKPIIKFYQTYKEEFGLYGLEYVTEDQDAINRKSRNYIPRYATCFNRKDEEIWIYRFLNNLELIDFPLNDRYSYLNKIICNVAAFTPEELGCKNYLFIIQNKKMFNYLKDSKFQKNSQTNVMVVYSKDDKTFEEPELLFGKIFLK